MFRDVLRRGRHVKRTNHAKYREVVVWDQIATNFRMLHSIEVLSNIADCGLECAKAEAARYHIPALNNVVVVRSKHHKLVKT